MITASTSAAVGATPAVSVRSIPEASQFMRSQEMRRPGPVPAASLAPFSRDLQELVSLQDDWDSYGAMAPRRTALEIAWRAASALSEIMPAPQVFPTRRGGVQLEWHRPNTRLEWEIDPDGATGVFVFDNHASGESVDGELPDQYVELGRALAQIYSDR